MDEVYYRDSKRRRRQETGCMQHAFEQLRKEGGARTHAWHVRLSRKKEFCIFLTWGNKEKGKTKKIFLCSGLLLPGSRQGIQNIILPLHIFFTILKDTRSSQRRSPSHSHSLSPLALSLSRTDTHTSLQYDTLGAGGCEGGKGADPASPGFFSFAALTFLVVKTITMLKFLAFTHAASSTRSH